MRLTNEHKINFINYEVANNGLTEEQASNKWDQILETRKKRMKNDFKDKEVSTKEYLDKISSKRTKSDDYNMDLIHILTYTEDGHNKNAFHRIADKVAREANSPMFTGEDIFQVVISDWLENGEKRCSKHEFIFSDFKFACLRAVRTETSAIRKFLVQSVSDEKINLVAGQYHDFIQKEEKWDLENLLSKEVKSKKDREVTEYDIFNLEHVYGYTKREIDEILGTRCDRVRDRVKNTASQYFSESRPEYVVIAKKETVQEEA